MKAALDCIPWINVKKTEVQERKSVPKSGIYSETKFLYHLQKNSQVMPGVKINPEER